MLTLIVVNAMAGLALAPSSRCHDTVVAILCYCLLLRGRTRPNLLVVWLLSRVWFRSCTAVLEGVILAPGTVINQPLLGLHQPLEIAAVIIGKSANDTPKTTHTQAILVAKMRPFDKVRAARPRQAALSATTPPCSIRVTILSVHGKHTSTW